MTISKNLRYPLLVALCVVLISAGAYFVTFRAAPSLLVHAADASNFDPGRIIDDAVFYNSGSMTAAQIQIFLEAKVPNCDYNGTQPATDWGYPNITHAKLAEYKRNGTNGFAKDTGFHAPPYQCLRVYKQDTPQMEAASGFCDALPARNNRTAAQIIDDVSKACGINPRVLIVLLEKEQNLITDNWPLNRQLTKATGFACPDPEPGEPVTCDPAYGGFFYQVYHAARQFKVYKAYPNNYNYRAGRNNNIYYQTNLGNFVNPTGNANDPSRSGKSGCGYKTIYIQNQATAALYIYTPYQPNKNALVNLYGSGDGCSAYGNRNFWRIFTDWFGSTREVGIYTILYDISTDTSGETGKVGYGLTKKPSSSVTIKLGVTSKSNAVIVSSSTITIQPENWNKPENNTVIVKGIDNPNLTDTVTYQILPTANPTSKDPRYNNFPRELVGDATLIQQRVNNSKPVYRLYSTSSESHRFTASSSIRSQLIAAGWRDEGVAFQYCSAGEKTILSFQKDKDQRLLVQNYQRQLNLEADGYVSSGPVFTLSSFGSKAVYWRYDSTNNRSLYTLSQTEGISSGFTDMGIIGYSCSSDQRPVYRLYKVGGSHFYTTSIAEREKAQFTLGYRYERLSFYSCTTGRPVHRLLKTSTGVRLYTTSISERDKAISLGYQYEGTAFYACNDGKSEIYRLYEQRTGRRLYTTSSVERDAAVKSGFTYEGVAFST